MQNTVSMDRKEPQPERPDRVVATPQDQRSRRQVRSALDKLRKNVNWKNPADATWATRFVLRIYHAGNLDPVNALLALNILVTHGRMEAASELIEYFVDNFDLVSSDDYVVIHFLAKRMGRDDLLERFPCRVPETYSAETHDHFVKYVRAVRGEEDMEAVVATAEVFFAGGGTDEATFIFLCHGHHQLKRFDELKRVIGAYGGPYPFYSKYYLLLRAQALTPDVDRVDEYSALVEDYSGEHVTPHLYINYLSAALRWRGIDEILDILTFYFPKIVISQHGRAVALSAVDRLIDANRMDEARSVIRDIENAILHADHPQFLIKSAERALKIDLARSDDLNGRGWIQLYETFSTNCVHEFDQAIADRLFSLQKKVSRKNPQFFDACVDTAAGHELHQLLEQKVAEKKPFLFVRLGSNDSCMLPQRRGYGSPTANRLSEFKAEMAAENPHREQVLFGASLTDEQRAEMRAHYAQTLAAADLVGLPLMHHICRDYRADLPLTRTRQGRGTSHVILEVVKAAEKGDLPAQYFTDQFANRDLCAPDDLRALSSKARRTIVVSHIKEARLAQNRIGLKDPMFVQVPLVQGTDVASESKARLDAFIGKVQPGDLVLVCLDGIGKAYLHAGKQGGAVALDLGSHGAAALLSAA